MEQTIREMKKYAKENWIPIVLDETAVLLEQIVQVLNAKNILEIGTAIGYSTILMARNLGENCHIDTIEILPERVEMAWNNINKVGLQDKIRIIEGDANVVLPLLNKKYDLIFSDAAKSQYIKILPECIRLLNKGDILLTDNMFYKGKTFEENVGHKQRTAVTQIKAYVKELDKCKFLSSCLLNIGDGVMISKKEE